MSEKKNDLPAMPFYFGDWRKAPEIRALDLDVRMIWFEMLGLMWESTERGYLTLNKKPVSNSVITKMLGVDITTFEKALQQLDEFNVFSRREDGAIYCRKMVKDEEIRLMKSTAGKAGMEKRYAKKNNKSVITPDITKTITEPENENEYENENIKKEGGPGEDFKKFWEIYNKEVDMDLCINQWSTLDQDEVKEIFLKLPEYIKSTPNKRYRKNPLTYLSNKSWKNEVIIEVKPQFNQDEFNEMFVKIFRRNPTEFLISKFKSFHERSLPFNLENKLHTLYKVSGGDGNSLIKILENSKQGELNQ